MNHFANGGFHPSVFFHGANQVTCSRAIRAQNFSGFFCASLVIALYAAGHRLACFANAASGGKRRFSFSVDSIELASAIGSAQLLIQASTSAISFGIAAVRFSWPCSVITTSSSIRTPIPRRWGGVLGSV